MTSLPIVYVAGGAGTRDGSPGLDTSQTFTGLSRQCEVAFSLRRATDTRNL
jgi:hypothetical protein